MVKKILAVMFGMALMAAPAFAGEQPEYDTVGCDATNMFNDAIKVLVCTTNTAGGVLINTSSNFMDDCDDPTSNGAGVWQGCSALWGSVAFWEFFSGPGIPQSSICFENIARDCVDTSSGDTSPYRDIKTSAANAGTYKWQIVLQKKPDTDLNINIVDCVLKNNSSTMFGSEGYQGAHQTGSYVMPWGEVVFEPLRNPRISAWAVPGCYKSSPSFTGMFGLDARTLPGLVNVQLLNALYTSKGPWEEGIVVKKPNGGATNIAGEPEYDLKQGDRILVQVDVPFNNSVDIRYGKDNVIIKYVGIHGEEMWDFLGATCNGNLNDNPIASDGNVVPFVPGPTICGPAGPAAQCCRN
jgi:hypothetical protein